MAVSIREVSKVFATDAGEVQAIDGVDFEVGAGEGLAVVGPSGCGKSTLLSMVGALEPPSSGEVWIDGTPVATISEEARAKLRRRRIGFVFQSDNLQPFMTALENVSFALALAGIEGSEESSARLLDSLGLAKVVERFPDQLSGGERQRVAVARALVHRPGLILADEPTGSLDTDSSATVIDLLLEAQRQTGATLIVITHDRLVAERLGRQIALADGRIMASSAQPTEQSDVLQVAADA